MAEIDMDAVSDDADDRTDGEMQELDGPFDSTDYAIIRQLQHDGRMPYRQIARELGISEGTVRTRMARLQESGAVSIVAIAAPQELGFQSTAFILVTTRPDKHQSVIDALSHWREVTYISTCTGAADLYVQLVCRDNTHLWDVLHRRIAEIDGIQAVQTFMELRMHKVAYGYTLD